MTALFGGASPPKPEVLPPVPNRSDADVQAAAEAQRQKFFGSQGGRAATMFTGGGGVGADQTTSAVVRLFGNVGTR